MDAQRRLSDLGHGNVRQLSKFLPLLLLLCIPSKFLHMIILTPKCASVPGNRNADNIDSALEPWEHLVFPDRAIQVHEVKAFSVTSFGFGQKGAQALGVHPRFLFATLSQQQYDDYCCDRQRRCRKAKQQFQNAFYGGRMVTLKEDPPYPKARTMEALVDASARFG